jgi:hypothetical protein
MDLGAETFLMIWMVWGGLQEHAEFTELSRERLSSLQGQNVRRNSALCIRADSIQKV